MNETFDPYYSWLGIPPNERLSTGRPDHYRLLGLSRFEGNPEVIRNAAERQSAYVRLYALGEHLALSQRVLNELATAKACLLDARRRGDYDGRLRAVPPADPLPAAEQVPPPTSEYQVIKPPLGPVNLVSVDLGPVHRGRDAAPRSRLSARRIALAGASAALLTLVVGLAVSGLTRGKRPEDSHPDIEKKGDGQKEGSESVGPVSAGPAEGGKTTTSGAEAPAIDQDPVDTITNSIGMKLALIPAGEFMMGSQESSAELAKRFARSGTFSSSFDNEHPAHHVRITQSFYLGARHVTVGQFRQFADNTGYVAEAEKASRQQPLEKTWRNPGFAQTDEHPVVCVSWNDATEFCRWLSQKEGKDYRLPTEAQWEYACRAGTATHYWCGDDPEGLAQVANVADATGRTKLVLHDAIHGNDGYVQTSPVGSFGANAFGLYDMHGNAWQWCADWYDERHYSSSPMDDPSGPRSGTFRVMRGGSWFNGPRDCRSAHRGDNAPDMCGSFTGFRVSRAAEQPDQAISPPSSPVSSSPVTTPAAVAPRSATAPRYGLGPFGPEEAARRQRQTAETLRLPVEITNSIGMKLVLIPAGEFMMGSPHTEEGRVADERPQQRVWIRKPFYLGVCEVTQAQFQAVMNRTPSRFKGDTLPAENVSWYDAMTFCRKFIAKEGKEYRLPTEAEWEYACRAGTATPFSFGDRLNGEQANCNGSHPYGMHVKGPYRQQPAAVGSYRPNAFGLYDMHGNVEEWCDSMRVYRGGGWNAFASNCRSASQGRSESKDIRPYRGFRVARNVEMPKGALHGRTKTNHAPN